MPIATSPAAPLSRFESRYDPRKVIDSPDFRLLDASDPKIKDKKANIACAYNEKHEINMVAKPMPEVGEGEVLVHVRSTGICGSDVHFWKHGHIGPTMIVTDECGSGHESAGEIIALGPGVNKWAVGDRVAIEAGVPCSRASCPPCRSGRYNACPNVVFFSTPPYHGTLTRFHAHPAEWLHRLPDNVSYEEGSLCEPLAVALAGLERADIKLGDPIVICGAGPIGLVTLLAARAAGCYPIIITDLIASRLSFAQSLVPTVKTVQIQRGWDEIQTSAEITRMGYEAGLEDSEGKVRVAMECTGFESSIRAAIHSVVFGGKVFVIGVGPSEQKFPFGYLSANEIDLQFQYRYANQYPKALRLVAGGLINLKPLVTHRFPLEQAVDAFHIAADPTKGAIKVQIQDI